METLMYRTSTALLIFLMLMFMGLGFYGLGQHISKHIFNGGKVADQVR